MIDELMNDFTRGIFSMPEPPCLSLYQPTHRSHPQSAQDPIRFGNLVKTLADSLRQKYPKSESRALLEPFQELAVDSDFWNSNRAGLAVLGSPSLFRVYRLERSVGELAVVADSFHIKPLLRMVQSADQFHILALSRQEASMYQGNRDGLYELELAADFPRKLTDIIDMDQQVDRPQPIRTHSVLGGGGVHGTASKRDLEKSQVEQFFRAVDRAVLEQYSRPLRLPLVLLALPENQGEFRRLSHNPFLLEQGIDGSPGALSNEALRQRAWTVIEPQYLERLAALSEMFAAARPHGQADADLTLVARSAVAGRIATLLIEADRQIPGRIDPQSGVIESAELVHPEVDDLLDDLAELVLARGGQVVIVPSMRMPSTTGAAAIYRF